jgi:hypothetical protein
MGLTIFLKDNPDVNISFGYGHLQQFRYNSILFTLKYWKNYNDVYEIISWLFPTPNNKHSSEDMPNYNNVKNTKCDIKTPIINGLHNWVYHSDVNGKWDLNKVRDMKEWVQWLIHSMSQPCFEWYTRESRSNPDFYQQWADNKIENVQEWIDVIKRKSGFLDMYEETTLNFFNKLVQLENLLTEAVEKKSELILD